MCKNGWGKGAEGVFRDLPIEVFEVSPSVIPHSLSQLLARTQLEREEREERVGGEREKEGR